MNPFLIPLLPPPRLTRSFKRICEKCGEVMCTTEINNKVCIECSGPIQDKASSIIGKWYKRAKYKKQLPGGLVAIKKTHGVKNGAAHNIMKFL